MITKEKFIDRSNKTHKNKFDYSLVDYKNTSTKVKIICPKHGVFEQTPHSDLYRGCPSCSGLKKPTTEEFKIKAIKTHGYRYDYSLVDYHNSSTKVKIICTEHGLFEQSPNSHISQKHGCPKCSGQNKTAFEITENFNKVHNNKYTYDFSNYKNKHSKVSIICPEHGKFNQVAYQHLNGVGCPTCAGCKKKTTDEFIIEANKIHNFKYDYSLTIYKNSHKKVKIICPEHGIFEQTPNSHTRVRGCPHCITKTSKGENTIIDYFNEKNIKFIPQYKFEECKLERKLPFDFYLPDKNMCIEYDGEQHFKTSKAWGGEEKLKMTQLRDKIKTDFCINNNITLIRIKYDESILEKLQTIL